MKPPMPYYGGKQTIAARIAELLPEHDHYVEPFAGSLAVLLAKHPAPFETVNDLDRHLMTFWRVLRDQPEELVRVCSATPHSRAEYEAAYDLDGLDDVERARRVWVRLTQSWGGTLHHRHGWRCNRKPTGPSVPQDLARYVERMEAVAQRLASVTLECRDAIDLVEECGAVPTVCLYLDPPYLGSTRNSTGYRHEMAGEAVHRDLAAAASRCASAVVVSGYHSPLYDELYAGWHHTEMATRAGRGARGDLRRVEVLWSNRPLGQPMLWDHRADAAVTP